MTNEELDTLGALGLLVVNDTMTGALLTRESEARIREACLAVRPLVAEVRRLRGVVREAYEEGLSDGIAGHGDPWEVTAARRALDGDA